MRRFLTASICLVILFAGFGCGDKKGSSKTHLRDRARVQAEGLKGEGPSDSQKPLSGAPIVPCENPIIVNDGDSIADIEKLFGAENSDKEYVLTKLEVHFSKIEQANIANLTISTDTFVDDSESEAEIKSKEDATVVCKTDIKFAEAPVKVPNRIDAVEGTIEKFRNLSVSSETNSSEYLFASHFSDGDGKLKDLVTNSNNSRNLVKALDDDSFVWNQRALDESGSSISISATYKKQDKKAQAQ